jgi:hypothetical protein
VEVPATVREMAWEPEPVEVGSVQGLASELAV